MRYKSENFESILRVVETRSLLPGQEAGAEAKKAGDPFQFPSCFRKEDAGQRKAGLNGGARSGKEDHRLSWRGECFFPGQGTNGHEDNFPP